MNRIELEKRLIGFSSIIITFCKECHFDDYTYHLAKQVVRSGSSAALNYGEAQSAESRADFVHKLSLVLKELRETQVTLTIIGETVSCNNPAKISFLLNECNVLISIFQKSINTLNNKTKQQ
jgi:four helix bundle protein